MTDEFEKHRGFIESLPGPVKLLVVDAAVAVSMIWLAGIPPEWAIAFTFIGDACVMIFRKRGPGDDNDY
jgi:hypothetical protein